MRGSSSCDGKIAFLNKRKEERVIVEASIGPLQSIYEKQN